MGINERTDVRYYPAAVVMIDEPVVCTGAPSLQLMASALQAGDVSGKGGTIAGGRIYTDATALEIDNNICNPP